MLSNKNNGTLSPPNNPNYELGALKGSPCDTIKPPRVFETISIYPNPTKDVLQVQLPSNATQYELVIQNAIGQTVFRQQESTVSNHLLLLSLASISTGIYTIHIQTEKDNFVRKFLKE